MEPNIFLLLSFVQEHLYLYNNSNCDFFLKGLINPINTEVFFKFFFIIYYMKQI